ncbi:PREDICTED: chymotrypsin-like protease CTRL-1 [Papilio xuthus]|uniref:Chymotrypsin-like protease CTRL-1 n=1 Tax=Papilio xuthus TaxID=66420 RepID=A0AAJ7EGN5_PAPXU|nr:PREDICTED: chymotrypsin-like protease CTRL-1 [Papilio xuthus]XP_013176667.1 PREDICTED: chymotrypsin-like protease CTRL-1 [Papilio xuthus]XP_013176668.1 PREDICTED: chymotrypsin-like protease CTRL-1 [Papilio xuthus]XP_013176669.1 PREDICTED: chymotrypsin-like protease CTRL-1 [Papilio xuthus]
MREAYVDGDLERMPGARWVPVVLLLVLLCQPTANSLAADEDLSQMGNEYKSCFRARDRRVGICVHFTQCYKNQSLAEGGHIFKYEVRDGAPPINDCGRDNWCCTDDSGLSVSAPPDVASSSSPPEGTGNCLRAFDDCPWCVALYRPGGDVNRNQRTKSGLYCGGALVSSRAVLTSAGCVATIAEESVWARVPASAAPTRNYAVVDKLRHEGYNSGNSKNDFGLLILKDSVEFSTSPFSACVSFALPPAVGCRAAGFDALEEVVLTPVSLRDGDCSQRNRSIPDLMCAIPALAGAAPCAISPGAPVLCPAGDAQGGLALAGVVRRNCRAGAARLGKLQPHADWLQLQLRRLGVPAWRYAL